MEIIIIISSLVLLIFISFYRVKLKNLNAFKKKYIGKNKNTFKKQLTRFDLAFNQIKIGNSEYLFTTSPTRATIKIFEFKNDVCTTFFIQSLESNHCIQNYSFEEFKNKFKVIEDSDFSRGIDVWAAANYFQNPLTIKIKNNRFGKIFLSKETNSIKKRPLHIYCIGNTLENIDMFLKLINDEFSDNFNDFNDEKMETGLLY